MLKNTLKSLHHLVQLQHDLKNLHPALEKSYPIAVVRGDSFQIYDRLPGKEHYLFIKSAPARMPIPDGI